MPKPASHIAITGSGKKSRSPQPKPDNAANLRAWRIGIIRAAWQRVVARRMETAQ